MKKSIFLIAQFFFTALLLAACTSTFSQKTIIWKGGAPGRGDDWHCPKNWSTGSVPDEFSNVIVPDVSTTARPAPIIKKGRAEVRSLFLESSVVLTIEPGAELVVQEADECVNLSNIRRKGVLQLLKVNARVQHD